MNVTFRQLRVFAEVAKLGSMSRAAEMLHLTPQAISMQVREIEQQVGLPLFDRTGRNVTLSTAGEYFLVHARRMLSDLLEAENAMARFKRLERGLLTIGIVGTATYFVPPLLARFHEQHEGIEVRLRVHENREALVEAMKAGEIDLSVMGRPPRELGARAEAFAPHPMGFVCAPDHPLLDGGARPAGVLDGLPFIVREHGSGTRAAMTAFLAHHRIAPRITMEIASNETIKQAVMAGLGVSFLSLDTIVLERRSGLIRVLDIKGTPVMRTWNIVHLHSRVLSPAAEAFRYFVIEQGVAGLEPPREQVDAREDSTVGSEP
jgi:DNA-binding transcriptional LysR family regulator